MVAETIAFDADVVASGRGAFHLAPVEAIPCADGSFDKTFAVNVFYFWPDPVRALCEMRGVLRPAGISIIAAVTPDTAATAPFAREELASAPTIGRRSLHCTARLGSGRLSLSPAAKS
jgi:SAM-dependent methyltransferase